MKIFFDTNVLVAAFISHGACAELFDHCLKNHTSYTSEFVVNELLGKLTGKFKLPEAKVLWASNHIRTHAIITGEALLSTPFSRDRDDDHILAAAIKADVDCIITGDNDLLDLKKVHGIPIISPRDFWKFEEKFKAGF